LRSRKKTIETERLMVHLKENKKEAACPKAVKTELSMKNMPRCLRFFVLMALSALFFTGCATPIAVNPTPVGSPLLKSASNEQEYLINPGDQLDIKFFYNTDLNELVTVRSDSRISLQLAGEIIAAGQTPAQLTARLREKYAPVLVRPDITVIVKESSGHKVFVDGEVNKPGVLVGSRTIRQCIAEAGGLKDTARIREILVIRQQKDVDPLIVAVNLETINNGTDFSQDISLLPYDIVYVPRSPIANADLWVKQYIRELLPFPVVPAITW
jgi:protein involved in polysaccharide export with SLBB domain